MLTVDQIAEFRGSGVLVVEDVIPDEVRGRVIAEYTRLLDAMYDRWHAEGRVPPPGEMDFYEKLLVAYDAGCEWFQPMDITLPGSEIAADTPFHIGPAVMDLLTCPRLLESQPKVCTICFNRILNGVKHLKVFRVWVMVRKTMIKVRIKRNNIKTEFFQNLRCKSASRAIAASNNSF